jgi:hypothetical protein
MEIREWFASPSKPLVAEGPYRASVASGRTGLKGWKMEFLILGSLQIRVADRLVEIGVGKQRALLGCS